MEFGIRLIHKSHTVTGGFRLSLSRDLAEALHTQIVRFSSCL